MNELRYWQNTHSIIDLNEVCAIRLIGSTGEYKSYKVTFKNGTESAFEGIELLKQFNEWINERDK